jgi:hypothetical protein
MNNGKWQFGGDRKHTIDRRWQARAGLRQRRRRQPQRQLPGMLFEDSSRGDRMHGFEPCRRANVQSGL